MFSDKAAKPVTAIHDCVSIFARVKPLDIFKETSGTLPAVFVVNKTGIFNRIMISNPK